MNSFNIRIEGEDECLRLNEEWEDGIKATILRKLVESQPKGLVTTTYATGINPTIDVFGTVFQNDIEYARSMSVAILEILKGLGFNSAKITEPSPATE
ncbi:MAG: hypothetical protein HZA34_04605 [Candidatus Pacebacteria bacterium]|nr:hypothetical protein [Candidatus Paceibacterota bacterium]